MQAIVQSIQDPSLRRRMENRMLSVFGEVATDQTTDLTDLYNQGVGAANRGEFDRIPVCANCTAR